MRGGTEGGRAQAVKGHSRALARRYARALLAVAATHSPEAASELRTELQALARLLATSPELTKTLLHPGLGAGPRRRLLAAVAERAGASPLMRRLLELVAERDRLRLLPALAEAYAEELNAQQGVAAASAATTVPLTDTQRQQLGAALAGALGKRVELATRLDPALVGGVLVEVGGRSYDGSVRTQLLALRRRLAAGSRSS